MKKKVLLTMAILWGITQWLLAQNVLVISPSDGPINDVINGDTLADGSRVHDVYQLETLDQTYEFTGPIIVDSDIKIIGVPDATTGRPPCIQPAVLQDFSVPPTFLIVGTEGVKVDLENLYLLAYTKQNSVNPDGVAISVTADYVRLNVKYCVFDGWQTFAIGYNGDWCDFFLRGNHFRNMVHPNQHYIGEVIRNTWPNEAYTDSLVMQNNTMLAINGYAAAPVTKFYTTYFEFTGNRVLYTFKNPFFIFNATDAKINDNVFYANYSAGVDQAENPWWDNLWFPDTSYGVIALQPLNKDNAAMFLGIDTSQVDSVKMAEAESMRRVEVRNNIYFWPQEIKDFWQSWNDTAQNKIITPSFMNERTVQMFADDQNYPYLVAENNVEQDYTYMQQLNQDILYGADPTLGDVGFFEYFRQIRTGTAATDYWGYGYTWPDPTNPNWVPTWPLPENSVLPTDIQDPRPVEDLTFELHPAYPNPFNPTTNISFTMHQAGKISLKVYNVMGQEVKTILNNVYKAAGTYSQKIDLGNRESGIYFVELVQGSRKAVQKIMLIK